MDAAQVRPAPAAGRGHCTSDLGSSGMCVRGEWVSQYHIHRPCTQDRFIWAKILATLHEPIYLVQPEPTSRSNKKYRNKTHKWQHFELEVFNLVTYLSESEYLYLNPCRFDSLKTYLFMKTFLMLAELLSESESHDIKVQTRFLSG